MTDDLLIVLVGIVTCFVIFLNTKRHKVLLPYGLSGIYLLGIISSIAFNNMLLADLLALTILPTIIVLYLSLRNHVDLTGRITTNSLILTLAGLFMAIEISSLATWLAYPISPSRIYDGPWWYSAHLEAQLFYAFGLLAPPMTALLIFSYGTKPAVDSIREWLSEKSQHHTRNNTHYPVTSRHDFPPFSSLLTRTTSSLETLKTKKASITILIGSLSLAVFFSAYPYLPSINNNFQNLSVDTPYYVNQINIIHNEGLFSENGPFEFANERALSILVFYALVSIVNQPPEYAIPLMPIFLGMFSVVASYFLARYVFGKKSVAAAIITLITALSMQFVVGIYGGFFSNMLAFSIAFASILFLLRYLDRKKWLDFAIFSVTLFAVLLTHVYTWIFLVGTIVIATAIFLIVHRKDESRKEKLRLYLPIILLVSLGTLSLFAIGSMVRGTSGLDFITNLLETSISSDYFAERWFNFNYTFRAYLGGFLTNPVMTLLALIWALGADYKSRFNVIILSSIFIASFFFFFGDTVTQSRVLYNIPSHIPAAIVLARILTGRYLGFLPFLTRSVLVSLAIIHFGNYALRSLANMNPIQPL